MTGETQQKIKRTSNALRHQLPVCLSLHLVLQGAEYIPALVAYVTVIDAEKLVVFIDDDFWPLQVQLFRLWINHPFSQQGSVCSEWGRVAVLVGEEAEDITIAVAHIKADLSILFPGVRNVPVIGVISVEPLYYILAL